MPDIDIISSGEGTDPGDYEGSGDIGSGGTTVGGGTVVIQQGTAPTNYQYDIVSMYSGSGNAYLASKNSSISCHSSVAVFSRSGAFSALDTSNATLNNCCTYAAQTGFFANNTSHASVSNCVSSIANNNYRINASSSMYANLCASVFPVLHGVHVSNNSSWDSSEFETMTAFWATTSAVPTHYRCAHNSFCNNSSLYLTSKSTAGLSGPFLNQGNISFIWSQIYEEDGGFKSQNAARTIFPGAAAAAASYRFVPINHSIDYSNSTSVGQGDLNDAATISRTGLFAMMAFGRDGYRSVKPPAYLYQPEDGSGSVGVGGLTGTFSAATLISAL